MFNGLKIFTEWVLAAQTTATSQPAAKTDGKRQPTAETDCKQQPTAETDCKRQPASNRQFESAETGCKLQSNYKCESVSIN